MLIVGAGPAGVAAAVPLAAAGRHVVVADKATFPRDKCCGDGLTTLALRELELLGFEPAAVPTGRWSGRRGCARPPGDEVVVPLPTGPGVFAAVAPGAQLDAALVDVPDKAGADVLQGHGADGTDSPDVPTTSSSGSTSHDTRRRSLRHRRRRDVVADAQGCSALGEPGYLGEWHAFRQYARDVDGPAGERLYVWFDADLLPGYVWSFPLPDGRVNVGFGIQRDGTPPGAGHEAAVGRPARAAARASTRSAADVEPGGPPHGVADPGRHRPRHAHRRAVAVRRRRGDGRRTR